MVFQCKRRRRHFTWRANLEPLEPRCLLAAYVVNTLVDENDTNHGAGDFSLREALASAQANPGADTISFAAGLSGGTIHLSLGTLLVQSSVTLDGLGSTHLTIDADDATSVFQVSGASVVTISNLAITGGHASSGGGLKLLKNTSTTPQLTLTRVKISGNQADVDGGGIYSDQGKLTIIESEISGNIGSDDGGGVSAIRGSLEVRGSTISNNICGSTGGGIHCSGPTGVNDPSHPVMFFSNTTVGGNSSGKQGGGVDVDINAARFVNCTIVDNHANETGTSMFGNGGGIWTRTGNASSTLFNTIVAGNKGGTSIGSPSDLQNNVESSSSFNLIGDAGSSGGLTDGVNHNQVGNNGASTLPLNQIVTTSLANHGGPTSTYTLANASPALDAGSNARAVGATGAALTTDQRGTKFARIKDGPDSNATAAVDIGAVEMELPDFSLGAGANYTENATAVLLSPTATMFGDFASFPQATLTVSITGNAATGDRIKILNEGTGAGQVGVRGSQLTYGGTAIGTFSPTTGVSPVQIDFTNASKAAVQAVLRRIAFSTNGDNPSTATRTVLEEFSPFQGQEETSDTVTVSVQAVNDAPVLTLSGSIGYVQDAPAVVLAPNASVTDVDSANFGGGLLNVHISSNNNSSNRLAIGGGFVVDASNNVKLNGVIIGQRTSDGVGTNWLLVQLNANATPDIVQQLVRSITFKTVGGSAGQRTIEFTVSDGDGGLSDVRTKTVNVT